MTAPHNRVYKSDENLAREDPLGFKIAKVAAVPVRVAEEATDMLIPGSAAHGIEQQAATPSSPNKRQQRL